MDIYDKLDKAMNHVNELWISIRDDPRYPDLDPIKVDAMLHWILTARDYTAELRREWPKQNSRPN